MVLKHTVNLYLQNNLENICLNDLVPELKQLMDGGKMSFTPAVEISRIRTEHQKYIAVSIEGQQSSPSKAQAKKLREMDEKNQLNPDVIDAVLSQEKKKEDFDVIIRSAELTQFFGKDKMPRKMKNQIMVLLGEWKVKRPNGDGEIHPLSGLLFYKDCGAKMHIRIDYRKGGKPL